MGFGPEGSGFDASFASKVRLVLILSKLRIAPSFSFSLLRRLGKLMIT
jgi:hypothetical protein